MCIVDVKYFYVENGEKVWYTDNNVFDELEPDVLLKYTNTIVKNILDEHPNATIKEINIW